MRSITLFFTILLFQLHVIAQFPQQLLPMVAFGDPYSDTLLNTKGIMMRAGIKKISAYQTSPELSKTFVSKTAYLNETGSIESMKMCFKRNKDNVSPCVGDTLLYDYRKRLVKIESKDGKGDLYLQCTVEYMSESEVKYTYTGKLGADTSINYKYFNEQGQMVGLKGITKGQHPQDRYSSLYYNADGLLDSIRYTNPAGTVEVFKRRMKGKKKEIEMENSRARFRWVYNLSGRCLSSEFTIKYQPGVAYFPGDSFTSATKNRYYYNKDGTLSRVTNEYGDRPKITMYYSYSK